MPSSIEDRVKTAFPSEDSPYVKEYADNLFTQLDSASNNINRLSTRVLIMIAVCHFVLTSDVAEVTIGPFRSGDIGFIQLALPVVIAYNYYELSVNLAQRKRVSLWYGHVIRSVNPKLAEASMISMLTDYQLGMFPSAVERVSNDITTRGQVVTHFATFYLVLVALGPFVYLFYAYYHLFNYTELHGWAVALSMTVAAFFIFLGALLIGDDGRDD